MVVALTVAAKNRSQAVILNQVAEADGPPHPLVDRLRRLGVAAHELRCGRRHYRAEVRALERLLRGMSGAVVHTHGYHAGWVGYHAARRAALPVVATVHGYLKRGAKERAYNLLDRWLLRRFDAVIAVSQGVRDELVLSGVRSERVYLVQNGLAPLTGVPNRAEARQRLGLNPDDRVVGWIGRLSPEKGPDLLLEALAGDSFPGRAVMVGDGPEQPRLIELARALDLVAGGRVSFAGYRPDAAELLPAFDVLALTSRMEGTPMVILEAVAAGVPIVAFEIGGVPALLSQETAWLVPPGETTALRECICTALSSPDEARQRAEKARAQLADRFGMDRWLEQVWGVYHRALGQR